MISELNFLFLVSFFDCIKDITSASQKDEYNQCLIAVKRQVSDTGSRKPSPLRANHYHRGFKSKFVLSIVRNAQDLGLLSLYRSFSLESSEVCEPISYRLKNKKERKKKKKGEPGKSVIEFVVDNDASIRSKIIDLQRSTSV